jgi:ferredoxin/flavodoxin
MDVKKANMVYFSPTNTTCKVVKAITRGTGLPGKEYDFTSIAKIPPTPLFSPDELVIIGSPVYVGRIPKVILPFIQALKGTDTPCVIIGVYGNRHYDDFLVEMEDLVKDQGFLPIGAAAFIGEHSFSNKLAGGRPDIRDLETAENFGKNILAKLQNAPQIPVLALHTIPGSRPYRMPFRGGTKPYSPVVNDKCINCGSCANVCPVGAISREDYHIIDAQKCLKCRACARACPAEAIDFADALFWEHTEQLVNKFGGIYNNPVIIL